MCSIEEAWAGQIFENRNVQSQSELRRKFMPIDDDLLTRNNEFSIGRKEPSPRQGNYGSTTKMMREARTPSKTDLNVGNQLSLSLTSAPIDGNNYGGESPRPGYMSIYDNDAGIPMPVMASRDNFNDINQAFQVSPMVEKFMGRNAESPSLLHEDNDEDLKILTKKFNSSNNPQNNSNNNLELNQLQMTVQDVLKRLDLLERELHKNQTRNMYDIVLYILIGMILAFILYAILRK